MYVFLRFFLHSYLSLTLWIIVNNTAWLNTLFPTAGFGKYCAVWACLAKTNCNNAGSLNCPNADKKVSSASSAEKVDGWGKGCWGCCCTGCWERAGGGGAICWGIGACICIGWGVCMIMFPAPAWVSGGIDLFDCKLWTSALKALSCSVMWLICWESCWTLGSGLICASWAAWASRMLYTKEGDRWFQSWVETVKTESLKQCLPREFSNNSQLQDLLGGRYKSGNQIGLNKSLDIAFDDRG